MIENRFCFSNGLLAERHRLVPTAAFRNLFLCKLRVSNEIKFELQMMNLKGQRITYVFYE